MFMLIKNFFTMNPEEEKMMEEIKKATEMYPSFRVQDGSISIDIEDIQKSESFQKGIKFAKQIVNR